MNSIYMTPREASDFLRISMSKLYKMTANHAIPHYKCGKLLLFKQEELIEFIEQGQHRENVVELNPLELLRIPSLAA